MNRIVHNTVLLQEAVEALMGDPCGTYIDGTYGYGGHSGEILSRLSAGARLLAFDKDPNAIQSARQQHAADPRFDIVNDSFSVLSREVDSRNWRGKISGVLLDLGVSSPQLDVADRGFSFMNDGPLDMRMDTARGMTAAEWVNTVPETEMIRVFREYGEERFAKRIAAAIGEHRVKQPFTRTLELADVISKAMPIREKGKHPATRVFQAIRIEINHELDDLQALLAQVVDILAVGGKLVVISFHSLEDRIVKRFMRNEARSDAQLLPRNVPVTDYTAGVRLKVIGKASRPSDSEIQANPRARSAIMRVAEKVA